MVVLAISSVAFSLAYTLVLQAELLVTLHLKNEKSGSKACQLLKYIHISLLYFVFSSTLTYFWYRQRVLYSQLILQRFYTKTIRCLSLLSLVLTVVPGLLISMLYFSSVTQQMTLHGCVSQESDVKLKVLNTYHVIFNAIAPLILIGLFLYPLLRHYRKNILRLGDSATNEIVFRTIRRSLLLLLAYLVGHFTSTYLVISFTGHLPTYFRNILMDLWGNYVGVAVVFSFDDYKNILFGLYHRQVYVTSFY